MDQADTVLQAAIDAGYVFKADTLAELAGEMGLDAATLEETVAAYNGFCEAGEDADFGKDPKYLKAFRDSEAYSELIWGFVQNPDEFADFVNGIVASVKKSVDAIDVDAKIAEAAKNSGKVMNFVTPSNP